MSEEVHLLLSSIELCGGRFGINVPIDVLRGSRVIVLANEQCFARLSIERLYIFCSFVVLVEDGCQMRDTILNIF